MNSRKPIRRLGRVRPIRAKMGSVPPLFLTIKLRKAIERLLPGGYYQRLRQYFDIYGCLHCSRKNVLYGANGFCMLCISMIGKRMRKVDKELRARKPALPPKLEETYLRPYNSARQLLADLMPKIGKGLIRKKPEPKSPPKVYIKF
ncbi:MAG: hypothetical protein WCA19_03285 [Candidatus Acidiferrales bacterium]